MDSLGDIDQHDSMEGLYPEIMFPYTKSNRMINNYSNKVRECPKMSRIMTHDQLPACSQWHVDR